MDGVEILGEHERFNLADVTSADVAQKFPDAEYLFVKGGRETVYAVSRTSRNALLKVVAPTFQEGGIHEREDFHQFDIVSGPAAKARNARALAQQR